MSRSVLPIALLLVLAQTIRAQPQPGQTTGVPGENDLTIDQTFPSPGGNGSGLSGCTTMPVVGGTPMTLGTSSYANAAVIGMVSHCAAQNVWVTPAMNTYFLELEQPVTFVFDGSGLILPANGLTPFFKTGPGGTFSLTAGTPDIGAPDFAVQEGLVSPAFPDGWGTTQAFLLTFGAADLCPATIGGDLSPLSEDGSIQVALSGSFDFFGSSYSTLFVNMNGNITFVSGDASFSPSEPEMLDGPPRIAPCWDDWSPVDPAQGTVRAADQGGVFEVEWHDVHHAGLAACGGGQDSNTFCATLDMALGTISLGFGGMLRCQAGGAPSFDQVVGISPGGGLSAPNNVDLSAMFPGAPGQALYEVFALGTYTPFDLTHLTTIQGQRLLFTPDGGGYSLTLQ